MKAQYINHLKKWYAFMTVNGVDIYELGSTERQARNKLANRISKSDFLLKGIKLSNTA